jgi:hypothetical protein
MNPMCGAGRIALRSRRLPYTATPRSSQNSQAAVTRRQPFYTPSVARAVRYFSSTRCIMTATKIDGTAIAKGIRERLGGYIQEKQAVNPRYKPSLKIVQGTLRS